ncbi:MAG: GntR family transcriptional regulator, partial [bacterium]|nr:GntR family transcriptional regulator [bacterium]
MEKAKQLKRDDSTPLYIQLRDMVKDDILNEKLLPGDKLPDLKSLCQIYNIGLVTARQAITELVNEGLVYRRPWHGTFVNINVKDTPAFRNRLKTVAFVAPNIMDLMITGTVYGLERNCRDKGYHLLFCNSENNYSMERERIEDLIEKKVDGVVIWLADEDGQGNLNENYIRSIALGKRIPF